MAETKTVKVRQIGSPIRRRHDQRETLIGLKLNKLGRVSELPDTPATRGTSPRSITSFGWWRSSSTCRQGRACPGHPRLADREERYRDASARGRA